MKLSDVFPSESLGARVLLQMAIRIAVVIAAITVASYWNVYRSVTAAGKTTLAEYVRERGERESQIFLLAEDNLHTLMQDFMVKRDRTPAARLDHAFDNAFKRRADGAWRLGDFKGTSAYIAERVKVDAAIKHEMVTILDLVANYGRAWHNRFASLFLVSIDGYDVTFLPGVDWTASMPPNVDFTTRPWVQPVLPANDPERTRRWTAIWYDDISQMFAATCVRPQDVDGRFRYYAGTSVSLDDIMRRTRETALAGTYNVLFRADGQLISHPDDAIMAELKAGKGSYAINQAGDAHLKAIYDTVTNAHGRGVYALDAYDELLGVARIAGPEWYFVTVMPKAVLAGTAVSAAQVVLWLGLGALLLELIVVGWILRRQVTRPLRHFLGQVTSLGRGELQSRVAITGRDELAHLGQAFNRMAESIEESQRKLAFHAADLEAKVAERTLQLEDKDRAKTQFLSAASHDLRQPVQAQGLFLEVLSRTALDDQQRKLLDNVRASYDASLNLLNTLLEYSRIEAGVLKPRRHNFALQPLFNKIESEFAPLADIKHLIYRSRETRVIVHSDPSMVEQILRNLVANAIRYTKRGGVLVACRARGGKALLEVWDTGIGIAPEHRRDIFREFQQLGNPERDRNKGLGLGLAIVDGLATCLGHSLELASRPGRGSLFRVVLPLATSAHASDEAFDELAPLQCKAHVLVIDDDASIRTGLRHLINDWGCTCAAAETIDEALALARHQPPDVVISDYRLRGNETGIAAVAALRAEIGARLPALLISGDTAPERLGEAQASGIPLLHKPVNPERLRRQLMALLTPNWGRTVDNSPG